jgi:hypothetical protein
MKNSFRVANAHMEAFLRLKSDSIRYLHLRASVLSQFPSLSSCGHPLRVFPGGGYQMSLHVSNSRAKLALWRRILAILSRWGGSSLPVPPSSLARENKNEYQAGEIHLVGGTDDCFGRVQANEYVAQFQYQSLLRETQNTKLIQMNVRLTDLADDLCNRGAA